MTISVGRTERLDIVAGFLSHHWLYEWFSQFHSCGTYSLLHGAIHMSVYLCPVQAEIFNRTSRHKNGQYGSKSDTWQPYLSVIFWHKRIHVSSNSFQHLVGHERYRRYKNRRWTLSAGSYIRGGWKICNFRPKSPFISKTVRQRPVIIVDN